MDYFIDRFGKRHALYPCPIKDCKNKKLGFRKFCSACDKKYKWDEVLNQWVNISAKNND